MCVSSHMMVPAQTGVFSPRFADDSLHRRALQQHCTGHMSSDTKRPCCSVVSVTPSQLGRRTDTRRTVRDMVMPHSTVPGGWSHEEHIRGQGETCRGPGRQTAIQRRVASRVVRSPSPDESPRHHTKASPNKCESTKRSATDPYRRHYCAPLARR